MTERTPFARHARARLPDDAGLTLTELMVALSMMMVVGVIFSQVLVSSLVATEDFEGSARSNDDVRLVLQQIDREFRSAERICEPTPGTSSNRLSFRTRAFISAAPASGYVDLIYELRDLDGDGVNSDLLRSADGGATWRRMISGIENEARGVPLFTTQGNAADALPSQGKVVTVTIWVDADPTDRIDARLAETEISGRNIWTPNASNC